MRLVSLLSCLLVASACAQPLVYNRGVLNAASFMPQGLAGGGIAQGSIFSIFGTRFGPGSPVEASAFPLGTTLGNVSVTLTQGATTVNAIPLYVSNTQVNAIMPSNAPLGRVSLRVLSGALKSPPVPVTVVTSAFGIFTAGGAGTGPGILQNYITAVNQPINEPSIAAQPGQTIILWGTGLGPVPGGADNVAPPAGNGPVRTVPVELESQDRPTVLMRTSAPRIGTAPGGAENVTVMMAVGRAEMSSSTCWAPGTSVIWVVSERYSRSEAFTTTVPGARSRKLVMPL